jgi:hypothetical protein
MTWRTPSASGATPSSTLATWGGSDVEFAAKLDQCGSAVSSSRYFKDVRCFLASAGFWLRHKSPFSFTCRCCARGKWNGEPGAIRQPYSPLR